VLIDKRRLSGVLHVRAFRCRDGDTDHYLMMAQVRERQTVSKQAAHKFVVESFNLKELNDVEVKEQCRVKL
jgi:hypothetical protein